MIGGSPIERIGDECSDFRRRRRGASPSYMNIRVAVGSGALSTEKNFRLDAECDDQRRRFLAECASCAKERRGSRAGAVLL